MKEACQKGCGRAFRDMEAAEFHEAKCDGTPPLKKGTFVLVVRTAFALNGLPVAGRGFDGEVVSVKSGVVAISHKGAEPYYARIEDVQVIA